MADHGVLNEEGFIRIGKLVYKCGFAVVPGAGDFSRAHVTIAVWFLLWLPLDRETPNES